MSWPRAGRKAGRTGTGQPLQPSPRPMLGVPTRPTSPICQQQSLRIGPPWPLPLHPHCPQPPLPGPSEQRLAGCTEQKAKGGRERMGEEGDREVLDQLEGCTQGAGHSKMLPGETQRQKVAVRELRGLGAPGRNRVPSDPAPTGSLSRCLCPQGTSLRGLQRGRMGLRSPAAYLGGLKEYCMCPQELRSERQCAQRGRGERQRREEDAKCKNRLETEHPSQADHSPRRQKQTAGQPRLDP